MRDTTCQKVPFANLENKHTEEQYTQSFHLRHIYYIAQQDGIPVGYLSIQPEGEDTYRLQKLYILPNYQGLGWGKRMFLHATKAIKELHPKPCRMLLNVNRHNGALHFYHKMGMTKVAEGDFAIGGGFYMNDYIMGLEL